MELGIDEDGAGAGNRSQEPIGISILARYLLDRGIEVNIVCPTEDMPSVSLKRALVGSPDYVGISCFMSDLPKASQFAGELKKISPGTQIIFGGPGTVTEFSEISSHPSIDLVVRGEGEYALEDILNEVSNGRGEVYKNTKKIYNNPMRVDTSKSGIPFRTNEMMKGKKRTGLTNPSSVGQKHATLYSSLGCNNHCKFCQTQDMFPGGITFRDPETVLRDVEECQERFATNYMFLMDPVAFGGKQGLKTGHAQKCAKYLEKTGMSFYAMARLDMPEEYWDLFSQAGITKVGVGIESFTRRLKHGINIKLEKIEQFGQEALKRGIFCRGLFMTGYQRQTMKETEGEIEALKNLRGITDIRIAQYSPFGLIRQERDRLFNQGITYTTDISHFNGNSPVFKIEGADSPKKADEIRNKMYNAFYSSSNVMEAARAITRQNPILKKSYDEFNKDILAKIGCKIKYE